MDYEHQNETPTRTGFLAKDRKSRAQLAGKSIVIGATAGLFVYPLLITQAVTLVEQLFWAFVGELVFAALVFSACGLIWAITTPLWLERLLESTGRHLRVALWLFFAAYAATAILISQLH